MFSTSWQPSINKACHIVQLAVTSQPFLSQSPRWMMQALASIHLFLVSSRVSLIQHAGTKTFIPVVRRSSAAYLGSLGENRDLSLLKLTYRLCMLLVLVTAGRVANVALLTVQVVARSPEGWTVAIAGTRKSSRPDHHTGTLLVSFLNRSERTQIACF